MKNLQRKFLLYAALTIGCLCETVGCPQLLGNALRDGTTSFLSTGLVTVLLSSLDAEQPLETAGP